MTKIVLLILTGMGTLITVVGVGTAINSFNVYLPLIKKEPTPTPSPEMVCSNPSQPIPIPEQSTQGTTDTIQTNDNRPISDLDVYLDISHSYVGDLVIDLQHLETNTNVTIIDRPGFPAKYFACPGQDIMATLDDEANLAAEKRCNPHPPAISGEVFPNQPLSAFDDQSISGNWRLIIYDRLSEDEGALNNWCLTFKPGSP